MASPSLKSQRNRHSLSRIAVENLALVASVAENSDDDMAPPPFKRLVFDDAEDTDGELSDHHGSDSGRVGRVSSEIRKRIDFGSSDEDESKDPVPLPEDPSPIPDETAGSLPTKKSDKPETASCSENQGSPPKTRSGRIYKRRGNNTDASPNTPKTFRQPCPIRLNLLQEDVKKGKENIPMKSKLKRSRLSAENPSNPAPLPELKSPTLSAPPPLNYVKRPISRLSLLIGQDRECNPLFPDENETPTRGRRQRRFQDAEEAPKDAGNHSPPIQDLHKMKLFDNSPDQITSPRSVPRPRILFDETGNLRRMSAPVPGMAAGGDASRKRKRVANINPFAYTPKVEHENRKGPSNATSKTPVTAATTTGARTPEEPQDKATPDVAKNMSTPVASTSKSNPGSAISIPDTPGVPGKRIRVSDVNINRYTEEFIELSDLATGTYGRVAIARHRLDGVVYAVKMSKNQIYGQTHEERVIMNEIFAHSALMKHKHIVRYYNSWVENGRVFIQNEFCEGGSLSAKIKELKKIGKRFSEQELKKIMLHVCKGLQHLHSRNLVHLDIKPDNIFISLEHTSASSSPSVCDDDLLSDDWAAVVNAVVNVQPDAPEDVKMADLDDGEIPTPNEVPAFEPLPVPSPVQINQPSAGQTAKVTPALSRGRHFSGHDSTDSGNVSDNRRPLNTVPMDERVQYKIGDLGHVIAVDGDHHPEEGDCRYMAPELLMVGLNRQLLYKSDVFSLGLSLYEAASLIDLPKNSLDNPMYEFYKAGELPPLEGYSKEINTLIKAMVNPDPLLRPSVQRVVNVCTFRSSNVMKTKSQLFKELRETRAKLKLLEQALSVDKPSGAALGASPDFPTPPKDEEESSGDSANADDAQKAKAKPATSSKMWLRNKSKAKDVKETSVSRRTNLRKRTLSKTVPGKEVKTRTTR